MGHSYTKKAAMTSRDALVFDEDALFGDPVSLTPCLASASGSRPTPTTAPRFRIGAGAGVESEAGVAVPQPETLVTTIHFVHN